MRLKPPFSAVENLSNEVGGVKEALSLFLDDSQALSRKPCRRAPAVVTTKPMKPQCADPNPKKWDSVHKCPQCGHILKLDEIDLKAATTGIVICRNCDYSGPIEIQVIEREKPER
jgi:transcription elongation factor Elf1